MIEIHNDVVTQVHLFMSILERELLENLAVDTITTDWTGSPAEGYLHLDLAEYYDMSRYDEDFEWLGVIVDRALDSIRAVTGVPQVHDKTKIELLYCLPGNLSFAAKEPAPAGKVLTRLCAVVTAPPGAGALLLFENLPNTDERRTYSWRLDTPGEGFIFLPSEHEHRLEESRAPRLLLCVSVLI